MNVHAFLAGIWYLLLGLILILYVVSDGFDLGVGMLTLFERDAGRRAGMMAAIGGVWDANETWLVLFGGALFGAFPAVYAVTLHALYIPVSAMLFGLILRGFAFEFLAHARHRRSWALAFGGGSLATALAQGYMLGGVIAGLPVENGVFAGDMWSWFGPFPTVVAIGVAAGYALLGGTYLNLKTCDELQRISRRRSRHAARIMLAAAACVTLMTPLTHGYVAQRWFSMPEVLLLAMLPLAGLAAYARLMQSLARGRERAPFIWSVTIFMVSFVGLVASLYPYLVPPAMSLDASASSSATLVFMLAGIGLLLPVMLVYNGFQYLVFRGKIPREPPSGSTGPVAPAQDGNLSAPTTPGTVLQQPGGVGSRCERV
jgi:cytochrome d ubiquinol oxidase subunit II